MTHRAFVALSALFLLAMSAFAGAKDSWVIEAGRLWRVDLGVGSMLAAPMGEHVRNVAPIGDGRAWVLTATALTRVDEKFAPEVIAQLGSDEAARIGPMVADPGDGGVWFGSGTSLSHLDGTGQRVWQLSADAPIVAIAVAGPNAIYVATETTLIRFDSTGAAVARVDLAALPGAGVVTTLMDPVAGYLWLVRAGAVIQFDALIGLAPRMAMGIPGLGALSIDSETGVLSLVAGQEIRHYDRNAQAIGPRAFASEMLVDIAGIEARLRDRLLWFGDQAGVGTIDLTDGGVLRIPGGQRVDRFASDPLRLERRLYADVSGNAPTDVATQVTFRVKTFCNGLACAPSPAYLRSLRLNAIRDGGDVSSLFAANANHDEFHGSVPLAPWQIASPLEAWIVDAYGNRSNTATVTWPTDDANQRRLAQAVSPPTVVISAPLNNATYTAPLTTTIKATATPSTGAAISKVDFYSGATLLGTVTVSPYNLTWANVQAGTYVLTAKVTDSLNATATSTVVTVTVNSGAKAKPLAAYLFNDAWAASGVVTDAGGVHNGAPSGTLTSVTSAASTPKPDTCKAVSFGGGAVDIAGLAVSTAAAAKTSVAFWVNWSGTDAVMPIGWVTEGLIFSGGWFGFSTQAGDVYGIASTGFANKWRHIVAEFTNGAIASNKIYVDGVPQTLAQRVGAPNNTNAVVAATLRMGGLSGSASYRFIGQLDDVKVFNRALSAVEVSAEFAAANACGTAPTVTLTAPLNNTNYIAPASIPMTATAAPTAAGATLTKIEFYSGATLRGTSVTSPYAYTWSSVAIGDYPLTAKATDSKGTTATSTIATVHVKANVAPSVAMTAPANNSSYTAPATITLAATASDADGTIAKVEFFQGATRLATVTAAPYTYTWSNVAGGTYVLTARATDDRGAVTTSVAVNVKVNKPPTVSITAPANNAVIILPATITINASASDADGTVSKVEFYRDGILLGTDTSSPYSYAWTTAAAGTYVLTAKATDNLGIVTTSAAITITVNVNRPPTVSITGPLDSSQVRATTPLTINATAADADGTISKVEFFRDGVLLGTDTTSPYSYAWATPTVGAHVLTAKATDNKGAVTTSTPVSINVVQNQSPAIALTAPADQAFWISPSVPPNVVLSATASDTDGTIAFVRFYKQARGVNGDATAVLLGTITTAPYQFTWSSVPYTDPPPGGVNIDDYLVWAEATDNDGAATASNTAAIMVWKTEPEVSEHIRITSPYSRFRPIVYDAPATVVLAAASQDSPTVISKVEYSANGAVIGTITNPVDGNFAFVWRNLAAGTYVVTAKQTFGGGYVSISDPVSITVSTPTPVPTAVTLQTPPNEQILASSATSIAYAASLSDPAGTVTTVEIDDNYRGIAWLTGSPYLGNIANPNRGLHVITASAFAGYREVARGAPSYVVVPSSARSPVAVMTSPLAGGIYNSGAAVTLSVDAMAIDGVITRVLFYSGPALLGTVTTPPYKVTAAFNSGTQSVYALVQAFGTAGTFTTPVTFSVTGTGSGTNIRLSSPVDGQKSFAPANIPLAVTLTDPGHVITKVEYFWSVNLNGGLVASSTQAPFSATWSNVGVGEYVLTAIGYYSGGKITSAPVRFTVETPGPILLTAPLAGSTFAISQPITMTAQTALVGHTASRVEFAVDGVVVGNVAVAGGATLATVSFTWPGASTGTHALTATAVATDGYSVTSSPVGIEVSDFTVTLVEPFAGQIYQAPADIRITANPAETGATISQVDFYGDGVLLGSRASPPFSFAWTGVPVGVHTVSAKARDNYGFSVSSSSVTVTVLATPTVQVDSGIDGVLVADDNISISGTVQTPLNSAVIVNGIGTALDRNGRFFVDNVLLKPGTNSLTLTLNTLDGAPVTRTISVGSTGAAPFQVTVDPQEGLAPLSATLTIKNRSNVAFQRIEIDMNDDGTPEQTLTTLTKNQAVLALTFPTAGTYTMRVTVYGPTNNVIYLARRKVRAYSPAELGLKIVNVYAGMVARLAANNPAGALLSFTGDAQPKYSGVFNVLAGSLPVIAAQLGTLIDGVITEETAELTVVRDTPSGKQSFMIYLIRGGDGLWRIESM